VKYVIVEKVNNDVHVHGPFNLERSAQAYMKSLLARNPDSSYKITYLYPQNYPRKNPS